MPSPLRIRERIRSIFSPNMDELLDESEIMLIKDIEREFKPLEIPQEEPATPPIPEKLMSQQLPQKELVAGMEQLLPDILDKSKKQGEVVQIFLAITLLETVEETEAKFFFTEEYLKNATEVILDWAQAYQDKNYMLPPLMATVYWGFAPIVW
jgi:hypothetical protein